MNSAAWLIPPRSNGSRSYLAGIRIRCGVGMNVTGLDKQHAMRMLALDRRLPGAAKAVGCVLVDRLNLKTGLCFPSIDLIASETMYDVRTIKSALKTLRRADWITWERRGRSNHYKINWERSAILQRERDDRIDRFKSDRRQITTGEKNVTYQIAPSEDAVPKGDRDVTSNGGDPVTLNREANREIETENAQEHAAASRSALEGRARSGGADANNVKHKTNQQSAWQEVVRGKTDLPSENVRTSNSREVSPPSREVARREAMERLQAEFSEKGLWAEAMEHEEAYQKAIDAERDSPGSGIATFRKAIANTCDTARPILNSDV